MRLLHRLLARPLKTGEPRGSPVSPLLHTSWIPSSLWAALGQSPASPARHQFALERGRDLVGKTAALHYSCSECGYSTGRWLGRCPGCASFGTLAEEASPSANGQAEAKPLLRLAEVEVNEAERIPTGVPELDRVLGGGLVPASLVLVGGEPGVGKSTLLLMALASISRDRRALLVTGEESTAQVKLRAARLGGADDVEILAETKLEAVCAT